jgi:salicylate hydroxylase
MKIRLTSAPSLMKLLGMIKSTVDWPINAIDVPETWVSKTGKLVILGDAAHAMVPYMASGAAMAVEDAAAIAETLKYISSTEDIPHALKIWEKARRPRVQAVHEASFANGLILHLPDGAVQRARDDAMRAEIESAEYFESSNQWSDPLLTGWIYSHDTVAEVARLWDGEEAN